MLTATKWPKIRVEYYNPRKPHKIIELAEAVEKFGLDQREAGWLERGEVAGSSVKNDAVYRIWVYTQHDAVRDAAPELLESLKATADRLFVAYPDSDARDFCQHCGSEAVFNGVRLPLSKIGHNGHCRWLEARAQYVQARRIIAKLEE